MEVNGELEMMVLITYDVNTTDTNGERRLRYVSKECLNYGQRVQNSVFECLVEPHQFTELRHRLESIVDSEKDSLRYYFLGKNWKRRVEHFGSRQGYDPEGTLII